MIQLLFINVLPRPQKTVEHPNFQTVVFTDSVDTLKTDSNLTIPARVDLTEENIATLRDYTLEQRLQYFTRCFDGALQAFLQPWVDGVHTNHAPVSQSTDFYVFDGFNRTYPTRYASGIQYVSDLQIHARHAEPAHTFPSVLDNRHKLARILALTCEEQFQAHQSNTHIWRLSYVAPDGHYSDARN